MKTAYDIILRPIITEQSMEDLDIKKYVFGSALRHDRQAQESRCQALRGFEEHRDLRGHGVREVTKYVY